MIGQAPASSSSNTWRILFFALGIALIGLLVLVPGEEAVRRRR
jgi:hypothetical protein